MDSHHNPLLLARLRLLDLLEDLGGAATLLREADDARHRGNTLAARSMADEAATLLATLEPRTNNLAADLYIYADPESTETTHPYQKKP